MKKTILPLLFIAYNMVAQAPHINHSRPCQINVNTNYPNFNSRDDIKRSTFNYSLGAGCTGTLINNSEHRQFFITASHCLNRGAYCDSTWRDTYIDEVNHGSRCLFFFNYQSPNENTSATAYSNLGTGFQATDNISRFDGNEYFHESYVKLLYKSECVFGDISVLEIIKPIPPHFNVYYAGWSPETFNKPPFAVIHHPMDDIKKISEIYTAASLTSGTPSIICNYITQVIDILFSWVFGTTVSTNLVCNYLESQHYTTSINKGGGVEHGSSGAGLFDFDNQLIGVSSSSLGLNGGECNFIRPVEFYGKFRNQYKTQSLRSILNPTGNASYNIQGMDGWQRTVYPVLSDLNGLYFPANHYQAQNKIRLNSSTTINNSSTQALTVLNGANYEFNATGAIDISPGFEAELGSDVSFNTGVVQFQAIEQTPNPARGLEKLPKYKEFAMEETMKAKHYESKEMDIIPNPMTNHSVLTWNNPNNQATHIRIADVSGRIVNELQKAFGSQTTLDRNDLTAGFYFVTATLEDGTVYTRKLIITDK